MTDGQSGDLCFRVPLKSGGIAYLKSYFGVDPEYEINVSEWLKNKVPVATALAIGKSETSTHRFILWSALEGQAAHDLVGNVDTQTVVKITARAARKLHQIDIANCPLDQRLITKMAAAFENAKRGLVKIGDLDESRKGWTLERLKNELLSSVPGAEDLVFAHGDLYLPNLIAENDMTFGYVDLGRAGVADRHQDLALALRSLKTNLGSSHEDLFLEHYGLVKELDRKKMEFYQLLDEFF